MSPFVALALLVQACLLQSVMSQCGCGQSNYNSFSSYGLGSLNSGLGLGGIGLNVVSPVQTIGSNLGTSAINSVSAGSYQSYGGVGTGEVGVAGDIGANGNTIVVGSVPVLGAVEFSGIVPASGSVSISGQCGCSCN